MTGLGQALSVRFDMAPNVGVTLRAGRHANVVHASGLSRFAHEGLEEHVRGDLNVPLL
jgi:hypothetical protein